MFKNPLKKYATGGTTQSQEQEAENQLISAVAEGLGAQPEQVKARLEQIKSNPEEVKQLQSALQLMQQDQNAGFQAVLKLFAGQPQSAKHGGKIQDFVCKHARGGQVAGCGCGGSVKEHQMGGPLFVPVANEKHMPLTVTGRNPYAMTTEPNAADLQKSIIMMQQRPMYAESGTKLDTWRYTSPVMYGGLNIGERGLFNGKDIYRSNKMADALQSGYDFVQVTKPTTGSLGYGENGEIISKERLDNAVDLNALENPLNNQVDLQNDKRPVLAGMEDGGKVKSARRGTVTPDYEKVVNAVGDTTSTKRYNYSTQTRRTLPNGPVIYTKDTRNYSNNYWDPRYPQPSWFRRVIYGMKPAPVEFYQNWDDIEANHRGEITKDKTKSQEQGGKVEKAQPGKKLSTPVSTTPADSSKVERYVQFPGRTDSVVFIDTNGNKTSWMRHSDGTFNWRSGNDRMDFDPNQTQGFIPYSRFKQWNTATQGSTYMSPEHVEQLNRLFDYAKNRK